MENDLTYRERRLAKAERLSDWADKREAKAEALSASNNLARQTSALSQPMDGRTSKRINNSFDKEMEHTAKADAFLACPRNYSRRDVRTHLVSRSITPIYSRIAASNAAVASSPKMASSQRAFSLS